MTNENGQRYIGRTLDGKNVYASEKLIAQKGLDKVRYELVDREFIQKGMIPSGYYPIRISLLNDDFVLVKGESHDDALERYLQRKR